MQSSLAAIDTIIWDLDNTLYKFNEGQLTHWNEAVCQSIQSYGLNIPANDLLTLAQKGWTDKQNAIHYFVEDYKLCPRQTHIDVFAHANHTTVAPCAITPSLIKSMQGKRHAVLTYSTREWAQRVLEHTGLADFFEPEFIMGAEDYDFEKKDLSARGVLNMLDRLGGNAAKTLFVEDTMINLKPAKEQTGIVTAYLHHNRPIIQPMPAYVDVTATDTPELLGRLIG